jgi:hypothetical protein
MYTHRMRVLSTRGLLFSLFVAGLGLANAPSPLSAATLCLSSLPAGGPSAVLTSQYDNARDGYHGNETVLTASALGTCNMLVSVSLGGSLFAWNADTGGNTS